MKPKSPSEIHVTVYKVRDSYTGLYSKGGYAAKDLPKDQDGNYAWGAKGKTWASKGAVKNHLRLIYGKPSNIPSKLEIVECVTQVVEVIQANKFWDE